MANYSVPGSIAGRMPDMIPSATKGEIFEYDNLVNWLGHGRNGPLSPEDARTADMETIASRYMGKNPIITELVVIPTLSGQSWTLILAPLERKNGLEVRWKRTTFQHTLLDPEPELATASYVTHTEEEHKTTMIRFGKMARIGADYYKLPEGQQLMKYQVMQLTNAAWDTINQLVERTLITSKMGRRAFS